MPKECVNHAGAPALAACTRCQKALCRSCAVVTPTGTFCSPECKMAAREPKEAKASKGGGAAKLLLLIVLGIVVAQFMVFFAARNAPPDSLWRKLDLIGPLLRKK